MYEEARRYLEAAGFSIQAVVLDAKHGIREVFSDLVIQICQYHQQQIIRRYLTARPMTEAGQELKLLADSLAKIDEKLFTELLKNWHEKWRGFLTERIHPACTRTDFGVSAQSNASTSERIHFSVRLQCEHRERTYKPDGKHWWYTHKRIRATYHSLMTNLPYLFSCQKYPEMNIPNTNNSLEGYFSKLKRLLNNHNGLKRWRRYRLIEAILND